MKENIRNIPTEKKESYNNWCSVLGEAAYKKNITFGCCPNTIRTSVRYQAMERTDAEKSVYGTDTDKEQEEETNYEQQRSNNEDETVERDVQQNPTLTDENSTGDIQTNKQQQA